MSREIYAAGYGYVLYPMTNIDRENYVELHHQINGDGSFFLKPKIADIMWEMILKDEKDNYFSIYEDSGEYCGCIELQNPQSSTPEIGINLLENKRNQGIAAKAVKLLIQKSCNEHNIDYFLIEIMYDNSHSRHVFEKMGAIPVGKRRLSFSELFNKIKKIAPKDDIDKICDITETHINDEGKEIYRYKILPDTLV